MKNKHGIGNSAMVMCAGLGTRMKPLTLKTPKPLIKVAGKPLMAHAIDQLQSNGVNNIVVNTHYLADQVEAWTAAHHGTNIQISDERDQLLETGGGVLKACDMLGDKPFFVLNSDAFWVDQSGNSTLQKMRAAFDMKNSDFLLLLAKHESAIGFEGSGDFFCGTDNNLKRRGDAETAPFIFAGCYLMHPRVLTNCPEGPFSMNFLWDRALKANRICGLVHDGLWLHVGTPDAIENAETAIKEFQSNHQ